ncbi:conserved hypothetical protein [Coccidioides posadasii str. Silveira]|uniref:Uncharacterized protein n=1 Tax=Coccidioides posadasii (strain RMSCC 757 / Silveira) TaxID=443226 RepID=E9D9K3_COCPS|nr:conserved hypothetical protein [Coccidioides posadasii str. Silveira]
MSSQPKQYRALASRAILFEAWQAFRPFSRTVASTTNISIQPTNQPTNQHLKVQVLHRPNSTLFLVLEGLHNFWGYDHVKLPTFGAV